MALHLVESSKTPWKGRSKNNLDLFCKQMCNLYNLLDRDVKANKAETGEA